MLEFDFDANEAFSSGEFTATVDKSGDNSYFLSHCDGYRSVSPSNKSLVDVSVVADSRNKQINILRGPNPSPRLFFQIKEKKLRITTLAHYYLNQISAKSLSSEGLFSFLSHSLLFGVNHIRITSHSVLKEWVAVADQTQVTVTLQPIVSLKYDRYDTIWAQYKPTYDSFDGLRHRSREAVQSLISSFSHLGGISSEVSGGIDSGIVTLLAAREKNYCGAVTLPYPFPEFKREQYFRDIVTNALDKPPWQLHWQDCLPFTPCDSIISEPTLGSGSLSFFLNSLNASKLLGATVHLTGHGGDRLFCVNPADKILEPRFDWELPWVSKNFLNIIQFQCHELLRIINHSQQGIGSAWHPSLFNTGPNGGGFHTNTYVSGLISREVLFSVRDLWREQKEIPDKSQKPLAYQIFGDFLPRALFTRPGKVDHIGTVFRGAILNHTSILSEIHSGRVIFEQLYINEKKFIQYAEEICSGRTEAGWFFSAVFAVVTWYNNAIKFSEKQ